MTLTDTAIRQAKPADKARKLFDGRGLYLLILATGGKYWRLKYRFVSVTVKDVRPISSYRCPRR